jgi:rhamnose utilization protein RhaD (predicted bifunctional aldolase and dehydrogenase)/NAD(P)-dependent dehydrogenase (short-subunit alcohol dehydrogenase family)
MMKSLWSDEEARQYPGELGARVYTSRLLGRDRSLVLHGGGNTSVKIDQTDRFGERQRILFVKGSGWDLETIEERGFAPVLLDHVLKLARLDTLSDPDMVAELGTHLTRAGAPAPSVETILHGLLPSKYVDHTHADAVLALTNTADGARHVLEAYGDRVLVVPYVMPGFDLARRVAQEFIGRIGPHTVGMVLLNHGIFSFGATARESYERMIELVHMAETYLAERGHAPVPDEEYAGLPAADMVAQARLRRDISAAAGAPFILRTDGSAQAFLFARHPQLQRIAAQGPATPDHAIRTKRVPLLGTDVAGYVADYRRYFEKHEGRAAERKRMLDPAPRIVLDARFGLASAGRTARDAAIAEEIFKHTIEVIFQAERLGGYRALPPQDIFDVEYWDLEQAKLKKAAGAPPLVGEVALVTGAASGIGRAAVEALLRRGAAVVGLDIQPAVVEQHRQADFLGLVCDIRESDALPEALRQGVLAFGGLDMLVLNAGVFGTPHSIAALPLEEWRQVMSINADANLAVMCASHPLLALAPRGGRVVVIGSKNVPAPGPGAAAYSASKAALQQLARVAALEWASDGIRVNTLHPHGVFDTSLWSPQLLEERAVRYGMTVEQYKRNNLLRTEISSADVGELTALLCEPAFAKVTGAQIPVDGGNDRVV